VQVSSRGVLKMIVLRTVQTCSKFYATSRVDNVLVKIVPDLNQPLLQSLKLWMSLPKSDNRLVEVWAVRRPQIQRNEVRCYLLLRSSSIVLRAIITIIKTLEFIQRHTVVTDEAFERHVQVHSTTER